MTSNTEYKIPIILGVTGHRDIEASQYDQIEHILSEKIQTTILDKYPNTPVKLFTPLADGADRLVARIAIRMGLQIVVPLPMKESIYKETFIGQSGSEELQSSIREFDELVRHAESQEVFVLPQLTDEVELTGNTDAQARQFALLGAFMAKHCHILIALYDGRYSDSVGGTSQIVKYRASGMMNGLPLKIDSEEYEKIDFVMPDNMFDTQHSGLLWQITVSRKSAPHTLPVTLEEKCRKDSLGTVDYYKTLLKIHGFNCDVDVYANQLTSNCHAVSKTVAVENDLLAADNATNCLQDIMCAYIASDELAKCYKSKHFKYFKRFCLALSGIAVSEWIFSHGFYPVKSLLFYILFLSVGYKLHERHSMEQVHYKYNEYRALAEALRVQFYWRCAGLKSVVSDHYLRKHQADTNWISNAVKAVSYKVYIANAYDVDFVVNAWIKDQLKYYENANSEFVKSKYVLKYWKNKLYVTMYIAAIAGMILHGNLQHIMISATLTTIPLLFVLFEHKSNYMSQSELLRSYIIYENLYKKALVTVQGIEKKSEGHLQKIKCIIYQLGCEALIENGDWLIINRDKKAEKPG